MYVPCYNRFQGTLALGKRRRGSIRGSAGLGAVSDIQSQIATAADSAGIPASIALAVAQIESSFNQNAVSPAGAIGVMQLMPGTASDLGVNPNDTSQNIQGGVNYLAQLYDQFGNWADALAAYNAGPGNIQAGAGYAQSVLAAQPNYSSFDSTASSVSSDLSDVVSSSDVSGISPVLILGGIGLVALAVAFS